MLHDLTQASGWFANGFIFLSPPIIWQSIFGFGSTTRVNILLNGNESRPKKETSGGKGTSILLPIYEAHEVREMGRIASQHAFALGGRVLFGLLAAYLLACSHPTRLLPFKCIQGVSGTVEVLLAPGKKLEHLGIKIELVGTIGR